LFASDRTYDVCSCGFAIGLGSLLWLSAPAAGGLKKSAITAVMELRRFVAPVDVVNSL